MEKFISLKSKGELPGELEMTILVNTYKRICALYGEHFIIEESTWEIQSDMRARLLHNHMQWGSSLH